MATAHRSTPKSILAAAQAMRPWLVEVRRDLHQYPELGLEEHRTAARVQAILDETGIDHLDGIGGTGVLGRIDGTASKAGTAKEEAKAVALRGDMDALPIQDAKEEAPYRSLQPGKMHACGHDVHTTVLLGAAKILHRLREEFRGTVRLLFQPAEETIGGAKLLIKAGALTEPPVAAVFGLHVESSLEVGQFAVHYGQRNASSDALHLVIHGVSGHAAYPSATVDAIVVAAHVVSALQTVVSRNVDGRDAAVVTFGTIHGGSIANVITNRVELTGTVRTLDPQVRQRVLQRVREVVEGTAQALGGRAELTIEAGYDALINNDEMVEIARANAALLVGEEHITVHPRANMGVEDFAYYASRVPGAFFSLGVRNEARGIVHPEHHELFDVDEDCLPLGVAIQVMNALSILQS